MSTDKLNIPDDLAEKLARLGAEAGERPKEIENEIKKRRAAQTGFAFGASALIQREADAIDGLGHELGQYDQIEARARRMLGTSDNNAAGSDNNEQGNPPTDQSVRAVFTPHYQGYVEGRGHRFLFDASASTGFGDLTFSWDAGDGRPPLNDERNSRLEVFYRHEGAYLVTLRVTDSQNRSNHARQMVQAPPPGETNGDTHLMPPPPATPPTRQHRERTPRNRERWSLGMVLLALLGGLIGYGIASLTQNWPGFDDSTGITVFNVVWHIALVCLGVYLGALAGFEIDPPYDEHTEDNH